MNSFYKNKIILITGHTGFKGSWLSKILSNWEANITGYSLKPPTEPNLFNLINIEKDINSIIGDINDFNHLKNVFDEVQPEIVIHMAAQPLVRESYKNPKYTFETNVIGTVNICECVRQSNSVKSFLNVTTDKVYENQEWIWGYRENEKLNGFDPYSNSKSCSDLITQSYNNSFFKELNIPSSIARAGNVIGGGDFAKDRIVPDCVRAAEKNMNIVVRNPYSIRPYQHVLEPLNAYLTIIKKQHENINFSGCYNVGPDYSDCVTTGELVDIFCRYWGENLNWVNKLDNGPHESNFLKLDTSKIKENLNWKPKWNINKAIEKTVEWTKVYFNRQNICNCMDNQINQFFLK